MSIRLIGPTNAGIRLITSLLEHTCEVSFVHDTVAWSRDHASTLVRHSARHDDGTAPLVLVGSPYTVLGAWWDQRASTAQDDSSGPATMHEFIRSPVILREERPGHASELYYSSPVELWNSLTWNLLQRAEAGNGLVIRIEDAMADPRAARERIAAHYELCSRSPEHATPDAVSRSAADDGGTDRPGENFAGTDESLIRDTAARDLLDRLQYAPTGIDLGDECVPVEYEIFTMAGSSRLEDLTVLLQSNSEFDAAPVNVIPFDDPTSELERICSAYGATIVDPDDSWDALGSALYGEKEFRAGVPAWRYFRKLNALDHTSTPIVFIDANSAITNSLRPALKALREFDVVFGNRSKPGRNFTPWARKVVEHLSPAIGDGFGAAFWAVRPGAVDPAVFRSLADYPRINTMLARAPEQSVLSLGLALQRAKVGLLVEADPGVANVVMGARVKPDDFHFSLDGSTFRNRTALAVKWSGSQESRENGRGLDEVYSHFEAGAAHVLGNPR